MNNDSINNESSVITPSAPQERNLAQDEIRLKEFVRASREASAPGSGTGAPGTRPAETPAEPERPSVSATEASKPAAFQSPFASAAKPAAQAPAAERPAIPGRLSPTAAPAAAQPAAPFRAPTAVNADSTVPPVTKPVTPGIGQSLLPSSEAPKPAISGTTAASTPPPAVNNGAAPATQPGVVKPMEPQKTALQKLTEKRTTSVIADGTTIVGKIKTEGNLEVLGVVEGNIDAGGDVLVRGKVTGNIKCVKLELFSCQVKGMLTASADITIDSESTVLGNVTAENVAFDGKLKGNIKAEERVTLNSNSYLVGDISSKTITIGTGAVVNGQIKTSGKEDDEDIFEKLWPATPAKKSGAADRKGDAKNDAKTDAEEEKKEEDAAE